MNYPNREHQNADLAARRRALSSLDIIEAEVSLMRGKLNRDDTYVDGSDTQILMTAVRNLTERVATIETLRDVREWHALDVREWHALDQRDAGKVSPETIAEVAQVSREYPDGIHTCAELQALEPGRRPCTCGRCAT
jgi:hypothetical protein